MTIASRSMIVAALALAGCSAPTPPPTDTPPKPQATQPEATQLRDAIQAPQDKARAVEATLQEGADRQRAQIEADGG